VYAGTFHEKLGMILGFLLALLLILSAIWLISKGQDIQGFILFAGTIAGLVYSFRYGAKKADQELEESKKELNQ
jgi:hypothetical protein